MQILALFLTFGIAAGVAAPIDCGSNVIDGANLFSPQQTDQLVVNAVALQNRGVDFHIITTSAPKKQFTESIDTVMAACPDWIDLAGHYKRNLLLLSFGPVARRTNLRSGSVLSTVVNETTANKITNTMNGFFRTGDYFGGVLAGERALADQKVQIRSYVPPLPTIRSSEELGSKSSLFWVWACCGLVAIVTVILIVATVSHVRRRRKEDREAQQAAVSESNVVSELILRVEGELSDAEVGDGIPAGSHPKRKAFDWLSSHYQSLMSTQDPSAAGRGKDAYQAITRNFQSLRIQLEDLAEFLFAPKTVLPIIPRPAMQPDENGDYERPGAPRTSEEPLFNMGVRNSRVLGYQPYPQTIIHQDYNDPTNTLVNAMLIDEVIHHNDRQETVIVNESGPRYSSPDPVVNTRTETYTAPDPPETNVSSNWDQAPGSDLSPSGGDSSTTSDW